MGIEVTVINDGHFEGWLESAFRLGELYMTSAKNMVDKVLAKLEIQPDPSLATIAQGGWGKPGRPDLPLPRRSAPKLSRLTLFDHGNSVGFRLGSDFVTTAAYPTFRPLLAKLSRHFEPDGVVHMAHCDMGQNVPLMHLLADTFGVDVVGGTETQVPSQRWQKGRYVRVHPRTGAARKPDDWIFNGFEALYVMSLGR